MRKNILKKIVKYFLDKEFYIRINSKLGLYNNMDDKEYLERLFRASMGHNLDLQNPKTFNEKLQWLKLYNRNPLYIKLVDKYKVREYISEKIGEEYLIPLLGVWDDPEDIDFDSFPNKFVLKCNHDSGGLSICRDKKNFNINIAKKKLKKSLKTNYYYSGREWPYKSVQRKIIAEKYMVDESGYELKDYKIFCFNGEPKFIQIDYDRFKNHKRKFYDLNWEEMELKLLYDSDDTQIEKPKCLNKLLELSRELSNDIPFLRTDFYVINGSIYFGELTFYPEAGFGLFTPEEWDYKLGELIELPENKNNKEG